MDIDGFYRARIPLPCSRDMPLVIQADGKGVVMRPEALREATRRAAAKAAAQGRRGRRAPGEKPNRKRLATVAYVFDTRPAPRRPHDLIYAEAARPDTDIHFLIDFVHVAEYSRSAAHAFHKPGSPEAGVWTADRLTAILAGHAARVADELLAQADLESRPRTVHPRLVLQGARRRRCAGDGENGDRFVVTDAGRAFLAQQQGGSGRGRRRARPFVGGPDDGDLLVDARGG